jgi:integrase
MSDRGPRGCPFHDLRHFGLTLGAASGATTADLMHLAGHSDPAVALRSQHAEIDRDQAIADKLGAIMQAADDAPAPSVAKVHKLGS